MKITGSDLGMQDGWHNILVYGTPYQIGYSHGYLLAKRIIECIHIMNSQSHEYYTIAKTKIQPEIESAYPYLQTEMQGIANGVNARLKTHITYDDILTWNSYLSIQSIDTQQDHRCSAFIATGNMTSTGEIVMAHSTSDDYAFTSVSNVIMSVSPDVGHGFIMQTMPGYVCSSMDWFICTSGIMGCETTINMKTTELMHGRPYFARIRECMQFGNTLNDYARIMTTNRSNDYTCNWMFGNIHTNEIMLCELSESDAFVETKVSGAYFSSNYAINKDIRYKSSIYYTSESTPTNARAERLEYLLLEKYAGKINTSNAKKILSDHYDSYLGKIHKSARTICRHGEQDGTLDGKVVNTSMAKKMSFWGKYGSPCNQFKKWTLLRSKV